jgi:Fe-S-cluster containining protein
MLSTPKFATGKATLSWSVSDEGSLSYLVSGRNNVRLSVRAAAIALLADGTRNLGDIYDSLYEAGVVIEDPAQVIVVFRDLESTGALAMRWHLESDGPVRHECLACGESCEGHLIGPLSEAEIERLVRMKSELAELEPDLLDEDAVITIEKEGRPTPVLNTRRGHCVFLMKNRLCAIHAHYAPEEKPLQCRVFPLRVIQTEAGFRVGIISRCTLAHRSFQSGEPKTPEQAVEETMVNRPAGRVVGLDPSQTRSLTYTRAFEVNQHQEAFFMALLAPGRFSFVDIVSSANGELRDHGRIPQAYLSEVALRLRRFTERYWADPLNSPDTNYGKGTRAFMAALAGLPDVPSFREPTGVVAAYLSHVLRQFVYLRETSRYPQLEVGVHVVLIGLLGALWTTGSWETDGGVSDELGRAIAYWLRLHNSADSFKWLFDGREDYATFRDSLSS